VAGPSATAELLEISHGPHHICLELVKIGISVLVVVSTRQRMIGHVRIFLKFRKMTGNILETVRDRDIYNGRPVGNHTWPTKWQQCQ